MPPVKKPKKPLKVMEKAPPPPVVKIKKRKKNFQSLTIYLYKVMKTEVKEKIGISRSAITIMNDFMIDTMENICVEAARMVVHGKKRTMASDDVQSAVRLVIPGELATHANVEGMKALAKLHRSMEADGR